MRRFRSLLLESIRIQLPGLRIHTVAVHRHLPEITEVEPHRHRWSQVLLYLDGEGRQHVAGSEAAIGPGSVVALPPGVDHAFVRGRQRSPVCLMINFRLRKSALHEPVVCVLNRSELGQVRQWLTAVSRRPVEKDGDVGLESALHLLEILKICLRAAGWLVRGSAGQPGEKSGVVNQWIARIDLQEPLDGLVRRSGYQRDYLNRLVKRETGLTLGQYRSLRRLEESKRLLAQGLRISSVATAVGLPDQNYFARWFRRQTGQAPSRWLGRGPGAPAPRDQSGGNQKVT
ncbi:hypothetical protein DB347_02215 [Opitutaceae bacterium EW11]|nr:hypothetical protein DB347_02215 [Opitutaceae bacterium EW11]